MEVSENLNIEFVYKEARRKAAQMMRDAGIFVSVEDEENIVVNDFELGELMKEGAQILEWLNTKRVGVRMIVLLPYQTLPEHYHRATEDEPGKEETLRVAGGTMYVYTPGEENIKHGFIPKGQEEYYTAHHEIVMKPGSQMILEPGTVHWFQSGSEGAVVYTFTSQAKDRHNIFTNPRTTKGCVNDLE